MTKFRGSPKTKSKNPGIDPIYIPSVDDGMDDYYNVYNMYLDDPNGKFFSGKTKIAATAAPTASTNSPIHTCTKWNDSPSKEDDKNHNDAKPYLRFLKINS